MADAAAIASALSRMLLLLVPGFHPGCLPVPVKIPAALDYFETADPINARFDAAFLSHARAQPESDRPEGIHPNPARCRTPPPGQGYS